jgi:hypothetical protein
MLQHEKTKSLSMPCRPKMDNPCSAWRSVFLYGINKYLMIIQSIQRIVDYVRNDVVVNQYSQVLDPKSLKTYYECVTYTYKGTLDTYNDKGQNVDTKS